MCAIACMRLHITYPCAATCLDMYAQITEYKQQKLEEEERRVSKEIEDKKVEQGELDEKYASAKAKEGHSGCCDVSVIYRCASALNVGEQCRGQLCPLVRSVSSCKAPCARKASTFMRICYSALHTHTLSS